MAERVEEHLARERVAVRVQAEGGQPDEHVAGLNPARQRPLPLHDAHDEAGEIVVVLGVGARHLRRLAADQRAAELGAGAREAGDDLLHLRRVHLAERDVVEEEQRQSALDEDVVDAVGDEVVTDACRGRRPRSRP